jgi:uncharacterized protein YozE (UPF0346 family)
MEHNLQNRNESKKSLTADTVQTLGSKPLRAITSPEEMQIFNMKLDICSLMVAERNMTEANRLLIINFLTSQFKDMSANDLEEAVKMYLGKKLNCDAQYCAKMSAEYLGIILSSYRVYKREKQATERNILPSVTTEIIKSDEDNYNEVVNYIERNAKLPEWGSNIYLSAYEYLVSEITKPTDDEKRIFAESVREKLKREQDFARLEGYTMTARAKVNQLQDMLTRPQTFANHCRVEYIKNYLTKKYSL